MVLDFLHGMGSAMSLTDDALIVWWKEDHPYWERLDRRLKAMGDSSAWRVQYHRSAANVSDRHGCIIKALPSLPLRSIIPPEIAFSCNNMSTSVYEINCSGKRSVAVTKRAPWAFDLVNRPLQIRWIESQDGSLTEAELNNILCALRGNGEYAVGACLAEGKAPSEAPTFTVRIIEPFALTTTRLLDGKPQ